MWIPSTIEKDFVESFIDDPNNSKSASDRSNIDESDDTEAKSEIDFK